MGKKIVKKKKATKNDPLAFEKSFLVNVIKRLDECAKENENNNLGAYFESKANLNRERLKNLK